MPRQASTCFRSTPLSAVRAIAANMPFQSTLRISQLSEYIFGGVEGLVKVRSWVNGAHNLKLHLERRTERKRERERPDASA